MRMNKKDLQEQLVKLQDKKKDILAGKYDQETEVYSRIVGYLRELKAWNKGRAQEFKDRVNYDIGNTL